MTYSIAELRRDVVGARAAGVRRIGEGFFDGFDGPAPASIAIGVFDGLHVGHSELLARTVDGFVVAAPFPSRSRSIPIPIGGVSQPIA